MHRGTAWAPHRTAQSGPDVLRCTTKLQICSYAGERIREGFFKCMTCPVRARPTALRGCRASKWACSAPGRTARASACSPRRVRRHSAWPTTNAPPCAGTRAPDASTVVPLSADGRIELRQQRSCGERVGRRRPPGLMFAFAPAHRWQASCKAARRVGSRCFDAAVHLSP